VNTILFFNIRIDPNLRDTAASALLKAIFMPKKNSLKCPFFLIPNDSSGAGKSI